ncbi:MAG: hypothetical protein ABL962_05670 [Fimbriimonadaceae bacterium]
MAQIVSYERLADTALNAALEIRKAKAETPDFNSLSQLVTMLRDPIQNAGEYKLLTDARNLPVYRAAWEQAGMQGKLKQEVFLDRLSDFLTKSIEYARKPGGDRDRLYEFCLALNRLFLEKSAKRLIQNRTAGIDALA